MSVSFMRNHEVGFWVFECVLCGVWLRLLDSYKSVSFVRSQEMCVLTCVGAHISESAGSFLHGLACTFLASPILGPTHVIAADFFDLPTHN